MSYRIIPQKAEDVKDGFLFTAKLAAYLDAYGQPDKKYAALVYAVRYGLGIADKVEELEAMCEIIDDAQEKKRKRFVKPTVDEVREYCTERGNAVDPEAFVDFYESKKWKIGKETMQDWKAAVRTWEHRDGGVNKKEKSGSFDTDEFFDAALRRVYDTEE